MFLIKSGEQTIIPGMKYKFISGTSKYDRNNILIVDKVRYDPTSFMEVILQYFGILEPTRVVFYTVFVNKVINTKSGKTSTWEKAGYYNALLSDFIKVTLPAEIEEG